MRAYTMVHIVALILLVAESASAHHPTLVNYDPAKFGTVTGKVAKVQWTNPHVVVALDVIGSDGSSERWFIEGYPPNTLQRNGWKEDSLREGIQITVSGWHARNQTLKIFCGSEVTFEDGSKRQFGCAPGNAWHCADGGNDCAAAKWIPSITEK